MRITNGKQINSPRKCGDIALKMHGIFFQVDLNVLPLAGCDVVLGIQSLRILGPILWNFDDLTIEFQWGTRRCSLKGLQQGPELSMEDVSSFWWLKRGNKDVLLQLIETENQDTQQLDSIFEQKAGQNCGVLDDIMEEFDNVFRVPTELQPNRLHDHAITMQEGVQPVSVRPYRYPFFQKAEIEKIVKGLLQSSVIRHSTSLFSAPVLLVRKADGTWRMCMDCRPLTR